MKKLINISIALIAFCAIAKAQPKFANSLNGISKQYGLTGSSVFKLDANGNSVWVKDFAGQIVPSTFSNVLYGAAFDGKNLYILEMQGATGSGIPPTMHTAVIKMDTLGNVLFTSYYSVQSPGGYGVVDIYPSFNSGAWILDNYSSGITQSGRVYKIDSTGTIQSILGIWYGSVATARKVCLMQDSTYVVCSDHRASTGGTDVPFSALIKFDESGSVIWKYSYQIFNGIIGEALFEQNMITDSSGNIYLFENYYGSTQSTVVIKINSSGTVVTSKLLPDIAPYTISDLRFENNEIIAIHNNEEIHFDTSLYNSCLNIQNFTIVTDPNSIPVSPTFSYSPATFSPANGPSYSYTPPVLPDYCATSEMEDIRTNSIDFNFYPNPAKDKITIMTELSGKIGIEILDLQGNVILKEMNLSNKNIDLSKFVAGIYLIRISNDAVQEKKMLVIEE